MISISYNKDLFLLIILALYLVAGVSNVLLGLMKTEKSTHYGTLDILNGFFCLAVFVVVLVF